MRSTPAAPPLWIFAASVALAAVVLAATVPAFLAQRIESGRPVEYMDEAVADFVAKAPRDRSILRVIAFGDSALGTATLQLGDMAKYVREREGFEIDFLRLWSPFCLLHHVLAQIAGAIDVGPSAVMIDTWILVYTVDEPAAQVFRNFQEERARGFVGGLQRVAARPSLLFAHQAYLFDAITGSTAGQVRLEVGERRRRVGGDGRRLRCDEANRRRLVRMTESHYPEGSQTKVDPRTRAAIEALLERADARRVRLIFFDIPKAPRLENLPGVREKREVTRALLREYAEQGRIDYLEYRGSIDDDDTCDLVHYRARGRDRYLPWFVGQLAALRRGEAPR